MGAPEDTRRALRDFLTPQLRGIQERLDSFNMRFETIDRQFAALESRMADNKAEILRTLDLTVRELSLRIELAAVKNRTAEAAPAKAASIEHQQ